MTTALTNRGDEKGTKINFKYDAEENTLLTNVFFDEYADITNVKGSCDHSTYDLPFQPLGGMVFRK